MKKLNHANVIRLYEVIEDPEKDKFYMSIRYKNREFLLISILFSNGICLKRTFGHME